MHPKKKLISGEVSTLVGVSLRLRRELEANAFRRSWCMTAIIFLPLIFLPRAHAGITRIN